MRINLRHKYLSHPRYNRYLIAVGNDANKAKRLYNANIRLAQAFHPIVSQFEVVLRNSINNKLSAYFSDIDWIINQKSGFMNDSSLAISHYFLKKCIIKTENNLRKKRIPVTNGKIISDQSFGFWISLFLPHHYSLISGQLIHIFPNRPPNIHRANIYGKLDKIREFRNRVNHCEPICFHQNTINCTETEEILNIIYELLNWIGVEIVPFIKSLDNVENKIENIYELI